MRGNIPARTAISLRLRVIPRNSGLARSARPMTKAASIGHHGAEGGKEETGFMSDLLEYTLGEYQKRIDKLKELKPNTIGYGNLMHEIDRLQDKLEQLRRQLAVRKR